jgi:SpoVK/Ycf46/Vps4 family AAA+-type ATPase
MNQYVKRFLLSLVSFAMMAALSMLMMKQIQSEMVPAEERDVVSRSDALCAEIKEKWGRAVELSSHELQIANSALSLSSDVPGFDAIGGMKNVKRELRLHVIKPLQRSDVFFASKSLRPPSGILLEGKPGTGKTMIATALAKEGNVPLIPLLLADVENKWVGESQKLLKAVFTLAEKLQPCIIFVDEIDGFVRQRSAFDQNHEYSMKTAFLQMMDKVSSQKIIVVAATNHSTALDPALRRRLPRRYTLQPPEAESREEILRKLLTHEPGVHDIEWLVQETDGLTGAELTEIYFAAAAIRNEALAENDIKIDEIKSAGVSKLPILCKSHWEGALKIFDGDASDAEDAGDTEGST